MNNWLTWVLAVMLTAGCGGALAQKYPVKPIRVIVPFPPVGASDMLTRTSACEPSSWPRITSESPRPLPLWQNKHDELLNKRPSCGGAHTKLNGLRPSWNDIRPGSSRFGAGCVNASCVRSSIVVSPP